MGPVVTVRASITSGRLLPENRSKRFNFAFTELAQRIKAGVVMVGQRALCKAACGVCRAIGLERRRGTARELRISG
jgi:hypothetical protein